MIIAHPPCTYLCNSGVRWLDGGHNLDRLDLMWQGADFFLRLLQAKIPKICIENPIQHKYARELIRTYDQIVQPHYFIGNNESKATCFWLKNLSKLQRTQWLNKSEIKQSVWRMPPGENRGQERSIFPVSIAEAMAEQWG